MTSNPPPPKAGQAQTADMPPIPQVSSQRPNETDYGYACRVAQTYAQMLPDYTVNAVLSHSSLLDSHERLKQALAPLAAIADEWDRNCMDESRPEWGDSTDMAARTEIVAGRGGKNLLNIGHAFAARTALNPVHAVNIPSSVLKDTDLHGEIYRLAATSPGVQEVRYPTFPCLAFNWHTRQWAEHGSTITLSAIDTHWTAIRPAHSVNNG